MSNNKEIRSRKDVTNIVTTEDGIPSDGKPIQYGTPLAGGCVFPIKGSVDFKTVITLKDGRKFSIEHKGLTGHPPSAESILQQWENAVPVFWKLER